MADKQWLIFGRFVIDGYAVIEAETSEDAKKKFDAGDFDMDYPTGSVCDWERRGEPEDCS